MTQQFVTESKPLETVSIIIGGKERELESNFNRLIEAETLVGRPTFELFRNVDAVALRALLWASLKDSTATIEEVGSWLNFRNLQLVQTALIHAHYGIDAETEEPTS